MLFLAHFIWRGMVKKEQSEGLLKGLSYRLDGASIKVSEPAISQEMTSRTGSIVSKQAGNKPRVEYEGVLLVLPSSTNTLLVYRSVAVCLWQVYCLIAFFLLFSSSTVTMRCNTEELQTPPWQEKHSASFHGVRSLIVCCLALWYIELIQEKSFW